MTVALTHPDLITLVNTLQQLPQFGNVRDRQRFIELTLGGTPAANRLVGSLDLDGAPDLVAVEVVTKLSRFGQVEYGKEALGVLLNGVIAVVGEDQADSLRSFFARYALDGSTPRQPQIEPWPEGPLLFAQEKVIVENTMFPVFVLQRAIESAESVVHLYVHSSRSASAWNGTGFLIASDLVMTNHHNVRSADEAAGTTVSFDYQLGVDGKPCRTTEVVANAGGLFCEELDYSILQLPHAVTVPPLPLSHSAPIPGEAVSVIQHPNGHLKQISLRNNAVQHVDRRFIRYTTSTEKGASGAPLLGHNSFAVVGLHHGAVHNPHSPNGDQYFRNEAIRMAAILDDLKTRASAIYDRLIRI